MLAIAVLIGLVLWLLITLIATLVGAKMGKGLYKENPKARLYGALIGFMLTMGAPITYWVIEYVYIQAKVSQLCESEGGITIYVTPEEWREQIGEEEWKILNEDWENVNHNLEFKFNKKNYYGSNQLNHRVFSYEAKDEREDIIRDSDTLYIDNKDKKILFRSHYFSVSVTQNSFKFWLNNINDCYIGDWEYNQKFFHRKYTNYHISKGNQP